MEIFDIVTVSIFAILIAIGLFRGFVKELFQFAAIAGGFFGAYFFYQPFAIKIDFISVTGTTLSAIAFITLFLLLFIIITVAGILVKKIIHMTPLGLIDRILGGISGAIKASLLLLFFTITVDALPDFEFKTKLNSAVSFKVAQKIPLSLKDVKSGKLGDVFATVKKSKTVKKVTDFKKEISKIENSTKLIKEIKE